MSPPLPPQADASPPAIVLGGGAGAVSVVRSLGRAGVPVTLLGHSASYLSRHSRYCTFIDGGADDRVQERWLTWLADERGGAVVLPCSDDGLELVARNRPLLLDRGYWPVEADDELVLAMLDKARTYALARECGVPAPRTWTVRTEDDLRAAVREAKFPCGLKPLHSHVFSRHFQVKLFVAETEQELMNAFAEMRPFQVEMLVTDLMLGPDHEHLSWYSYLDPQGEPLFHYTKRKWRQYPIGFGTGSYHETEWSPEIAELGLRFSRDVGLRGVVNIEFKRDSRDGQWKLVECNHRFTEANELVHLAGIDLARIAYDRALGRPSAPPDSFRTGVRLWRPVEDLQAAVQYRKAGQLSYGAWARSLMHRQHFPYLRLDDPRPTMASASIKGRNLLRRWRRRPRGGPEGGR